MVAMSQGYAATLVTVTPPAGSAGTTVFGINKHNVIAGSYVDASGVEHGFFGPLNGSYTTFDYGGTSIGTEPRALNDDGDIAGFAADPNFAVGAEFLREADGTVITFAKDGTPLDGVAQGIVKKRETSTGDYIDPNTGIRTGYLATGGTYRSDVDLGLTVTRTSPRSLNKHGTLAGFFVDTSGLEHGFIMDKNNVQVIDADSSGTTALEGINKKELVTGQVTDSSGNPHSFIYNTATGTFTAIDIPDGSVEQQAWGINDMGQIVGFYQDGTGFHGFLRSSSGTFVTLDDPSATRGTVASGINDIGQIVGNYSDANGTHGFLLSGGTYFTLDDPVATTITSASGINDMGQIVGQFVDANDNHGFLEVPAPNPPPPAGTTADMILRHGAPL